MKIALTGTPGTGKTSVAEALAQKGHEVIDLNQLIYKNKWDLGFDEDYQSTIADLPKVNAHIAELPEGKSKLQFVEGHLSHMLDLDVAIVLRTHPKELKQRLNSQNYAPGKIRENMEAEALAVITVEAMDKFSKIYEVNTTSLASEDSAHIVERILTDEEFAKGFIPGKFNWLEAII
jgi:adenylate kinase